MEDNFKKYHDYTTADFALDEEFIDAIWNPADEKEAYWQEVAITFPQQAKNMEDAGLIVRSLYTPRGVVSDEIKNRIWQRVMEKSQKGSVVKLERKRRSYWWAAAAVLLVFGGTWLFLSQENADGPALKVTQAETQKDIAPGGDRAVLTLADGTQIVLDSAGNGLIAREANAKILKLNSGEITYDAIDNSQKEVVQYNLISTPRGGQYQVTLPDGTKVWLNSISSIRFPTAFVGKDRRVEITGEAYFEVARDASKPFYVTTGDMNVMVLGTHFNINAYDDEGSIKTTLVEGSVRINGKSGSVLLKPGQQSDLKDGQIRVNNNVNTDAVTAWVKGNFYFDNNSIREVMRQISRWYDVGVTYDTEPSGRTFSGAIKRDLSLSQVMQVLKYNNVKYSIVGKQIIISQ